MTIDNLHALAEHLLARSSRLSTQQSYLLQKLHYSMRMRWWLLLAVLIFTLTVGMMAALAGGDEVFKSLGVLLALAAMAALLWLLITDRDKVTNYRLTLKQRQLASQILKARDSTLSACSVNKRKIVGGLTRWVFLIVFATAFLILSLYHFVTAEATITRWIQAGVTAFFAVLIVKALRTLYDNLKQYRARSSDDYRYLFLLPYRWKYVYQLPLLLKHPSFTAFEKKKIKVLYESFVSC